MAGPMAMNKDEEVPSMDGDDEKEPCDEAIVLGKRMDDMVETHVDAAAMCQAEGAGWDLCLIDDLMSGQIYFQETMDEEMTITARRVTKSSYCPNEANYINDPRRWELRCQRWCSNPRNARECMFQQKRRRLGKESNSASAMALDSATESYGVWVYDQCEPFSMFTADDIIEYEAVAMTAEFNASNESSTAAIDSDSMLIGAGIGAVVMLLVVGLFAMIMKWRKNTAKGQESDMGQVVDAPNVVHVEDDSAEVAKAEGAATVEVVDAEVPTPAGAAVTVAV